MKKNQEKIFKKELYSNIENMEDNILYDDIKNSNEIVDDIFKHLNKNKKLTKDVLILIFGKYWLVPIILLGSLILSTSQIIKQFANS